MVVGNPIALSYADLLVASCPATVSVCTPATWTLWQQTQRGHIEDPRLASVARDVSRCGSLVDVSFFERLRRRLFMRYVPSIPR